MLISIVIPVHNRAEMVKPTLESVKKQTHRPLHLVLVDNNSTDNTLSVLNEFKKQNEVEDFKIDVIEEKKPGACAARNAGAKLVQSEWLMFFDSDDTMDSCLVSKYVEKINSCGNAVDVVTTNIDFTNENGVVSYTYFTKSNFLINHIFHSCLSTQRYIVRRTIFEQVGTWNESVECWNDWELGIRILLKEPRIKVINDGIYVHVKTHPNSITGLKFSENSKRREYSVEVALRVVCKSKHKQKKRLIKYLIYRKVLLAGLYKQEGQYDLSKELIKEVYEELSEQKLLRWFYSIMYWYVSIGGRGSQRIVKYLVR